MLLFDPLLFRFAQRLRGLAGFAIKKRSRLPRSAECPLWKVNPASIDHSTAFSNTAGQQASPRAHGVEQRE